jgi:hypothetical protein
MSTGSDGHGMIAAAKPLVYNSCCDKNEVSICPSCSGARWLVGGVSVPVIVAFLHMIR